MAKDLEFHRDRLSRESAHELEQLRAQLQRVAMEHEVRFNRLHAKRSWVIATIFAELEVLHAALRRWGAVHAMGGDKAAAAATSRDQATKARDKLEEFYYPRAIWLERDLCDRLNHLISSLSLLLTVLDAEAKGIPVKIQGGGDSQQLTAELLQIVADGPCGAGSQIPHNSRNR